jgi:hypothetical protein
MRPKLNTKRAAAVLFSLIIASLLGLVGLLFGGWLWDRYALPTRDADDTAAYLCGLLVGGVLALSGGVACLWRFWPHVRAGRTKSVSSPGREPLGQ